MSRGPERSDERAWLAGVGRRVRLACVRRRESQDQVAKIARISRVTLGSIERGEHPAAVLAYVRLARVLGVSMDDLLDGAR
jgi:transcriptional regulator with XRE-family HTH domain